MAPGKRYFLKTVYRYGRVSAVEGRLLDYAGSLKNHLFAADALDGLVQELKVRQAVILKEHPKWAAVTVSMTKSTSRSGIPCASVRIGYHVIWLESVQGEVA